MLKIQQSELFTIHKDEFGLSNDDEMVQRHNVVENDGTFNTSYDQYYKGIQVDGGRMTIIGAKGIVRYATGSIITGLDLDESNIISEEDALEIAKAIIGADQYKWEDSVLRNEILSMGYDPDSVLAPKISLIISKKDDTTAYTAENFQLCYKVVLEVVDSFSYATVLIDANTGETFSTSTSLIGDWDVHNGRVETAHNGLREDMTTSTCTFCSNYRLHESTRNIAVYEHGRSPLTRITSVGDNNNNWVESDVKTAASAKWAVQKTWDYFWNRHGRKGSNYGKKWIYVYRNAPAGFMNGANAGYVHSQAVDQIFLRKDNGNSPAALDILAHEYTHALIAESSNLGNNSYDYEAQAICEGIGDIFGMRVEGIVNGGNYDWRFGESQNYSRYFNNPQNDYPTVSASKYLESGIYDNSLGKKYVNSGVLRKWFYLLSEGGSFNGQTVQGVGIETATDILYTSFNWWLWHNIKYNEFASQTIHATIAHWGRCSNEHKQLVKALKAVNLTVPLNLQPLCFNIDIDGPRVVEVREGVAVSAIWSARINEIEDGSGTFEWHIPESWDANAENNFLYLHNVEDVESQKVGVTYHSEAGSYSDTIVVHFSSESWTPTIDTNQIYAMQAKLADISKDIFYVYPNPASEVIHIEFMNNLEEAVNVEIYDLNGRCIKKQVLENNKSIINVSDVADGLYIIKCNLKGKVHTKKIMINK